MLALGGLLGAEPLTRFPVESETAEPTHAQNQADCLRTAGAGLSPDSYTRIFLHITPESERRCGISR